MPMLHNIKGLWKYILLESFAIHFLICNFTQLFTGKFWESPISGIFGFIITLFVVSFMNTVAENNLEFEVNLDMRIINVTYIYWQAVAYAAIYLLILQGINLSYIYFVGENIGAQMMLGMTFLAAPVFWITIGISLVAWFTSRVVSGVAQVSLANRVLKESKGHLKTGEALLLIKVLDDISENVPTDFNPKFKEGTFDSFLKFTDGTPGFATNGHLDEICDQFQLMQNKYKKMAYICIGIMILLHILGLNTLPLLF